MARIGRLCAILPVLGLAFGMKAETGVAPGLNRFSAALYGQLAKSGSGNLVFSPFSIAGALSMALAGARGQTADDISGVLGQKTPGPDYPEEWAALVSRITKAANAGGNQLLSANGLWVQQGFPLLPGFHDTLQNFYNAPPFTVDFLGAGERTRAAINAWTEEHTKGKIRELFPPGALDSRTRLVLSSAIYFYGKWEHAFRSADTHPDRFILAPGKATQADFMHQTARFGYAEIPSGQVLEMRYAGTGLAMDILLPKQGSPIDNIGMEINPDRLAGWVGLLRDRTVRVAIPKFRVESQFELPQVLSALGMASAFGGEADFSAIDDRRDLQLSTVIHKAYVDVAGEGTEAAAATGAVVSLVAAPLDPEPVFRADHPFLFLIRDTHSGLILFSGRLVNTS